MDKYTRYLKRLAKIAGVPTRELRAVWEKKRVEMIDEGRNNNHLWLQEVTLAVKDHFNIVEDHIALDKFKKYL